MIVLIVMVVAMAMFSSTLAATARQKSVQHEGGRATEAARRVMEDMRATDFRTLFARYNAAPEDDPDGPGTAHGNAFAIHGLAPAADDPDGLVGEIWFGAPGLELREDAVDERLGLPRDLNGDGAIDGLDHAGDYTVLPARVQVRWRSAQGLRTLELFTLFSEL